ncbi:MAG: proton-conducting transporter membrane subunit [Acidimicrobiia bacterium]|nr:proton-conducting transporter membrane subunit [Acidimicrobiia bacterium]
MLVLIALHFVVALSAPFAARAFGRRVLLLGAAVSGVTFAWLLLRTGDVLNGEVLSEQLVWVGDIGLKLSVRLDGFGLMMALLVSGIGVLVFLYATAYMPREKNGRFCGYLIAFAGSMLGLVLSNNLLGLFVFWELTTITSYLLIGWEDTLESARSAAWRALIVTGAGGLAMLAGFILIGQAAGTYELSAITEAPPGGVAVAVGVGLVLLGAFTKSAQFPFQGWLPDAMAAPTPVSAYLHSATMVKAGIVLLARFAAPFSDLDFWQPVVIGIGLTTMLIGGVRALQQTDLKRLLAFGTVSQLGFMTTLFGVGTSEAIAAGVAVIFAHSLFKAGLFMVAGAVDHEAGTRDLRELTGLRHRMPVTFWVATICAASMAAIPPLLGFLSKELAYDELLHSGDWGIVALAGIIAGSAITLAYSVRFVWGAFWDKTPSGAPSAARVPEPTAAHEPGLGLLGPPALLAALSLLFGLWPEPAAALTGAAAEALDQVAEVHLTLWNGLTLPLVLSLVTIALGVGLIALARTSILGGREFEPRFAPDAGYRVFVDGLGVSARYVSAAVQNGSLPVYLGVILVTAVALPSAALLSTDGLGIDTSRAGSGIQIAVCALVIVAALGTTLARRRFVAVMLLGAVGYGIGTLFIIQGGPDLALTQFVVETVGVIGFMLVLRHLPQEFVRRRHRPTKVLRAAVAIIVGVFVTLFALVAFTARGAVPISDYFIENAESLGGGKNIVNVIVVDFRGLDTLGEISVVTVAVLGIVSLVFAVRRGRGGDPDAPVTELARDDVAEPAPSEAP